MRSRDNNTHSIRPPVEVSDIDSADRGVLWTLESRFLGTGGLIVSIKNVQNGQGLGLRELSSRAATLQSPFCTVRDVIDLAG